MPAKAVKLSSPVDHPLLRLEVEVNCAMHVNGRPANQIASCAACGTSTNLLMTSPG